MTYQAVGFKKPLLTPPTQQELMEYFNYQQSTGNLVWIKPKGPRTIGDIAGCAGERYPMVTFNGVMFNVRNLVWIWHHGSLPAGGLICIDSNPMNTRIENLKPRRKPRFEKKQVSFL